MKSNDSYEIGCVVLFFIILAIVDFQYAVLLGLWLLVLISLIWLLDKFFNGLDWWNKVKNTKVISLLEFILWIFSLAFFICFFLFL